MLVVFFGFWGIRRCIKVDYVFCPKYKVIDVKLTNMRERSLVSSSHVSFANYFVIRRNALYFPATIVREVALFGRSNLPWLYC